MFYSQFILAKKGPLGTIWIAAHLERKLRKNQVADTDIGVSVDSIIFPDVPIALRLSSHLLLGVVRIYNRKVNYLFDDCSEALLKVKQAFRSTAVDLPPEESKAPYHSITLPEKFDLDDFELPENDIFQGNYVDHHISSREQITLQDTIDGASYSTSKFGLDERFGDGDMSGLDLEEELFLREIGTAEAEHGDERADPRASFGSTSTLKQDQHLEDRVADSEAMVDDGDECTDVMDYAQAPSTPGLLNEPNFSKVQEASTCDDHLESECYLTGSTLRENMGKVPSEDKQEVDWFSRNDTVSDAVPQGPPEENGYLSGGLEIKESEPQGQIESIKLTSECTDELIKESGVPDHTEAANKNRSDLVSVDVAHCNDHDSIEVGLEVSKAATAKNVPPLDVEVLPGIVDASALEKSCHGVPELALEDQDGLILGDTETQACQGTLNSSGVNLDAHDKEAAVETIVLRPCNSMEDHTDMAKDTLSPSNDGGVKSDICVEATYGGHETAKLGQVHSENDNIEHNVKENQVRCHAFGEDILASSGDLARATAELPAPEKLLSVPEGQMDIHSGMMMVVSPGDFQGLDEGDAGSKTAAGRKRTFTESTLTEQSMYSIEFSRQVHIKQMTGSVPDDDDLLSSILVGRNSSILRVKPTPPPYEVTSMKRSRAAPRSALKRKVFMDDTMVLHGDAIRQQLTNVEDIRRVRKKAPCTLSEISMIRKQHMEYETFLEPLFTGLSVELGSLHGQVYDLGRIKVLQNGVHDASLEFVSELGLPSQNDENGNFPETMVEPNILSFSGESGTGLEPMVELQSTSLNNRSHDIEDIEGPSKADAVQVIGQVLNDEFLNVRDNETAEPCENHFPSEHKIEEVDRMSRAVDEEWKPTSYEGTNDSHMEHMMNASTSGMVHASDSIIQIASVNESEGTNAHVDTDAAVIIDQSKAVPSAELEFAALDHEQAIRNDGVEKDGNGVECETDLEVKDCILPDMTQDAAAELIPDDDHGGLEYRGQSEIYSNTSKEQLDTEYPYMGLESMLQGGSMNECENPDHPDTYQHHMMDGEIPSFDLQDRDELSYLAENDTEFLNVDDDDLDEMADDDVPDAEDTQYSENSGWSSRTRAVSKYLQAAFIKEANSGRNSLSLEKLLIGKSRKEASRMFFETLVLKTRDYIHVEQRNPFGDVTIRPRTSLVKSNF